MAKFRLGAAALGLTAAALMAGGASAQVSSKADCDYEGGQVFDVQGATVCLVQIRPEEYRDEIYDGNQLGVKECNGQVINDGLFCKVTLVPAPAKPETAAPSDQKAMTATEEDAVN